METDPNNLVNYVCGSDYRTDEHREGDVAIKPDSEYPAWLFTMDMTRPKPNAADMENKNSIETYIWPLNLPKTLRCHCRGKDSVTLRKRS